MKMNKRTRISIFVLFFLLLTSTTGIPQEVMVPDDPNVSLNITKHRVRIDANNRHVNVTARITFKSTNSHQIEGKCLFPAPDDAGVQSLSMNMNGKTQEARMMKRDKAQKLYRRIVQKHNDPVESIKFLSDRYFESCEKNPRLAKYFARSRNVKVRINNKQYSVVDR